MRGRLGGEAEATHQGRHHVVGMALDVDGQLQQLLLTERFTHQGIGAHQARHDGRGTAAQASGRRHRQSDAGLQGHRLLAGLPPDPLGGRYTRLSGPPRRWAPSLPSMIRSKRSLPPSMQRSSKRLSSGERSAEAVKAGPDVGCWWRAHPPTRPGRSGAAPSVSRLPRTGPCGQCCSRIPPGAVGSVQQHAGAAGGAEQTAPSSTRAVIGSGARARAQAPLVEERLPKRSEPSLSSNLAAVPPASQRPPRRRPVRARSPQTLP